MKDASREQELIELANDPEVQSVAQKFVRFISLNSDSPSNLNKLSLIMFDDTTGSLEFCDGWSGNLLSSVNINYD